MNSLKSSHTDYNLWESIQLLSGLYRFSGHHQTNNHRCKKRDSKNQTQKLFILIQSEVNQEISLYNYFNIKIKIGVYILVSDVL